MLSVKRIIKLGSRGEHFGRHYYQQYKEEINKRHYAPTNSWYLIYYNPFGRNWYLTSALHNNIKKYKLLSWQRTTRTKRPDPLIIEFLNTSCQLRFRDKWTSSLPSIWSHLAFSHEPWQDTEAIEYGENKLLILQNYIFQFTLERKWTSRPISFASQLRTMCKENNNKWWREAFTFQGLDGPLLLMGLTDKAAVLVFVQRKDQMGQYDEMSKVLLMGPRVMSSASPSVTKPSRSRRKGRRIWALRSRRATLDRADRVQQLQEVGLDLSAFLCWTWACTRHSCC